MSKNMKHIFNVVAIALSMSFCCCNGLSNIIKHLVHENNAQYERCLQV